ncbi:MAG: hypothetical protein AAGF12_34510 [Myxococcota bacterium]
MNTESDKELSLAEINARGRSKNLRRAVKGAIAVIPGAILFLPGFFWLGWTGVGGAILLSVGIALALEKWVPSPEDDE